MNNSKIFQVLLIEDNPGDVVLFKEASKDTNYSVIVKNISDGEKAKTYLKDEVLTKNKHIDIICLDLNLPRIDGHELLEFIKSQNNLRHIPVIILSGSESDIDISQSYLNLANSYIIKPDDMKKYCVMVKALYDYWFDTVELKHNKIL